MVQAAAKLTFGTTTSDWQERVNTARMRAERVRKLMRRDGLAVILAARPDNTRYLTGLRGAEFMPQLWYVLFFAEHDPVVFAHAGWYTAWRTLRPGVRDIDVAPEVVKALYTAGADESPPINFHSGPTSFDRGFNRSGRMLQYGDLVYTPMCGVTYLGYRSCTYRTFVMGRKPNAREQEWYKQLLDRIDGVIDAIKPGATTADAAKHFPPATTWGYKDEAEVLTMEIGHGVGLYQYQYPIINRQWSLENPQVFEPGMVIAVEGREGAPRVGGVRLENMVVVTETGAEIIDHFPREEVLQAPA